MAMTFFTAPPISQPTTSCSCRRGRRRPRRAAGSTSRGSRRERDAGRRRVPAMTSRARLGPLSTPIRCRRGGEHLGQDLGHPLADASSMPLVTLTITALRLPGCGSVITARMCWAGTGDDHDAAPASASSNSVVAASRPATRPGQEPTVLVVLTYRGHHLWLPSPQRRLATRRREQRASVVPHAPAPDKSDVHVRTIVPTVRREQRPHRPQVVVRQAKVQPATFRDRQSSRLTRA